MNAYPAMDLGKRQEFHPPDLADLLNRLQQKGFRVSASEAIDAGRLLFDLPRQYGQDQDSLSAHLAPLFCSSPEEQAEFPKIFKAWLNSQPTPSDTPVASLAPPKSKPNHKLAILSGLFALLVVAVIVINPLKITQLVNLQKADTSTTTIDNLHATPPTSQSPTSTRNSLPTHSDTGSGQLRPLVAWLLIGLPILGLTALGLTSFGSTLLTLPQFSPRKGLRQFLQPWGEQEKEHRLAQALDDRIGSALECHIRASHFHMGPSVRSPLLNLRRTVQHTVQHLGLPQLHYHPPHVRPDYLILVEADTDSHYFVYWAKRLQTELAEASIEIRRFTRSAYHPEQAPDTYRLGETHALPMDRLALPTQGQRLVIVSEGSTLLDPNTCQWHPWTTRAGFRHWRQRVIFTPKEPRDWSAFEDALEQKETFTAPRFLVLPMEEYALPVWAEWLQRERLPEVIVTDPQRFPRLITNTQESALLDRDRPLPELKTLIGQLKLYLGQNGYYWLSACAAVPQLSAELVLLIGEQYFKNCGAQDEKELRYHTAKNYQRLMRLPWIRLCTLPDWFRLALLESLPDSILEELRGVLLDLPNSHQGRNGNLPFTTLDQATPEPEEITDPIYLKFLTEPSSEQRLFRPVPPTLQNGLPAYLKWQGRSLCDRSITWAKLLFLNLPSFRGIRPVNPSAWMLMGCLSVLAMGFGLLIYLFTKQPQHLPSFLINNPYDSHELKIQPWVEKITSSSLFAIIIALGMSFQLLALYRRKFSTKVFIATVFSCITFWCSLQCAEAIELTAMGAFQQTAFASLPFHAAILAGVICSSVLGIVGWQLTIRLSHKAPDIGTPIKRKAIINPIVARVTVQTPLPDNQQSMGYSTELGKIDGAPEQLHTSEMISNCKVCNNFYDSKLISCPFCEELVKNLSSTSISNNHPQAAEELKNKSAEELNNEGQVRLTNTLKDIQHYRDIGCHTVVLVGPSCSGKTFFLERLKEAASQFGSKANAVVSQRIGRTIQGVLHPFEFKRAKGVGPSYVFIDISGDMLPILNADPYQLAQVLLENPEILALLYYADAAIFFAPVEDLRIPKFDPLEVHGDKIENLFGGFVRALSIYEDRKSQFGTFDAFAAAIKSDIDNGNRLPDNTHYKRVKLPVFINLCGASLLESDAASPTFQHPERFVRERFSKLFNLLRHKYLSRYAIGFTDVTWGKPPGTENFSDNKRLPFYGIADLMDWLDYQVPREKRRISQLDWLLPMLVDKRWPRFGVSFFWLRWLPLLASLFVAAGFGYDQYQMVFGEQHTSPWDWNDPEFKISAKNLSLTDEEEEARFDDAVWRGRLQHTLVAQGPIGFIDPTPFMKDGTPARMLDMGGASKEQLAAVKQAAKCGGSPSEDCRDKLAEQILNLSQGEGHAKRVNLYLRGVAELWLGQYADAERELDAFVRDPTAQKLMGKHDENKKVMFAAKFGLAFAHYRQALDRLKDEQRSELKAALKQYADTLDGLAKEGESLFGAEFNQWTVLDAYGFSLANFHFDRLMARVGWQALANDPQQATVVLAGQLPEGVEDSRLSLLRCVLKFRDRQGDGLSAHCLDDLHKQLPTSEVDLRYRFVRSEWDEAKALIQADAKPGRASVLDKTARCISGKQAGEDILSPNLFLDAEEQRRRENLLNQCTDNKPLIHWKLHKRVWIVAASGFVLWLAFSYWFWGVVKEASFLFVSRFSRDGGRGFLHRLLLKL